MEQIQAEEEHDLQDHQAAAGRLETGEPSQQHTDDVEHEQHPQSDHVQFSNVVTDSETGEVVGALNLESIAGHSFEGGDILVLRPDGGALRVKKDLLEAAPGPANQTPPEASESPSNDSPPAQGVAASTAKSSSDETCRNDTEEEMPQSGESGTSTAQATSPREEICTIEPCSARKKALIINPFERQYEVAAGETQLLRLRRDLANRVTRVDLRLESDIHGGAVKVVPQHHEGKAVKMLTAQEGEIDSMKTFPFRAFTKLPIDDTTIYDTSSNLVSIISGFEDGVKLRFPFVTSNINKGDRWSMVVDLNVEGDSASQSVRIPLQVMKELNRDPRRRRSQHPRSNKFNFPSMARQPSTSTAGATSSTERPQDGSDDLLAQFESVSRARFEAELAAKKRRLSEASEEVQRFELEEAKRGAQTGST